MLIQKLGYGYLTAWNWAESMNLLLHSRKFSDLVLMSEPFKQQESPSPLCSDLPVMLLSLSQTRPVRSGFLLKSFVFVLLWSSFSKGDSCLVPLEVKAHAYLWCKVLTPDPRPSCYSRWEIMPEESSWISGLGNHFWREQLEAVGRLSKVLDGEVAFFLVFSFL